MVKAIDEGLPPHALCGCIDGEHCEREEQFKRLAEELDYERRSVEMKQVSIDSLNREVERRQKALDDCVACLADERVKNERLDAQWRGIVATVTAGNVALEAENERLKTKRPDWWALIAENERLSQERDAESARYDAAMAALAAVRADQERALLIVDAARNLDEHRNAGYASVVSYLIRLHEALTAGRQPDPRPET